MFLCLQCVVDTTICVCFGAAVGSLTMQIGPSRWPATERRGILITGRAFNCTIPKCSYIYSVWWRLCCTSFWSCCPLWQITRLADSIISNLDKIKHPSNATLQFRLTMYSTLWWYEVYYILWQEKSKIFIWNCWTGTLIESCNWMKMLFIKYNATNANETWLKRPSFLSQPLNLISVKKQTDQVEPKGGLWLTTKFMTTKYKDPITGSGCPLFRVSCQSPEKCAA